MSGQICVGGKIKNVVLMASWRKQLIRLDGIQGTMARGGEACKTAALGCDAEPQTLQRKNCRVWLTSLFWK